MKKEKCLLGCLKENKKVVNKKNVILNLFQDLIRLLKWNKVEMLKRVQHDVLFHYKAFTLIELLVVVLIIGILAAVAVPQYQKAVLKSRLMQDLVRVRAVHDGAEMYYMANGFYPYDVRDVDLDITQGAEIKNSENFTSSAIPAAFYSDETECIIIRDYYAACGRIAADYYVQQNVEHQAVAGIGGGPGRQSCCGKKGARMDEVCKSLAHKTTRDWYNTSADFNCYYLN